MGHLGFLLASLCKAVKSHSVAVGQDKKWNIVVDGWHLVSGGWAGASMCVYIWNAGIVLSATKWQHLASDVILREWVILEATWL